MDALFPVAALELRSGTVLTTEEQSYSVGYQVTDYLIDLVRVDVHVQSLLNLQGQVDALLF